MNLFILTFIIEGQVAKYGRTVQVLAKDEIIAKRKIVNHFVKTGKVELIRVSAVAAKFATDIFGTPPNPIN